MSELTALTAAELSAAMAAGEVSAEEVTQAHLDRIAAVDPQVHAFLHVAPEQALTEAELEHFAEQLDVIIASVARVQEVAADGIPPMTHAVPVVNVFREDGEVPCLTQEAVLSQAPAAEQGRFRVPRILSED